MPFSYPKATSYINHYIGYQNGYNDAKLAHNIYNIKARNFKQDSAYLIFIKDEKSIPIYSKSLIRQIKYRHQQNYIAIFILEDNIFNISSSIDISTRFPFNPIKAFIAKGFKVDLEDYPKEIHFKDIKDYYLEALKIEDYKFNNPILTNLISSNFKKDSK